MSGTAMKIMKIIKANSKNRLLYKSIYVRNFYFPFLKRFKNRNCNAEIMPLQIHVYDNFFNV